MIVDICICTHNPRRALLDIAVRSVAQQRAPGHEMRVLVVDNASDPPVTAQVLQPLAQAGMPARIVCEPISGTSRARMRAVTETHGDWILFVDDDNELEPGYVAKGLEFIAAHPEVGCFGGKLLLASNLHPPGWVVPFLPYLGIKDVGDDTLIGIADRWERWEPPTAGAFVSRRLLDEYRRLSSEGRDVFRLGAQGSIPLRCEDSLIMRTALGVGLANAYYPGLRLQHHLDPSRFRFRYLVRLLYGYGVSHVILEAILKGPQPVPPHYASTEQFLRMIYWVVRQERRHSLAYAIGQVAYHWGARREHRRQAVQPPA